MKANSSKRSSLYAVSYAAVENCIVNNIPGLHTIGFSGVFEQIPAAKIDMSEKITDKGCEVDLSIKITDTSIYMQRKLDALAQLYIVCCLHYSDGTDRLLGTDESPILFHITKKDSPAHYQLHYKGIQPEMAKFLQSF